jgi:hypothetical protein
MTIAKKIRTPKGFKFTIHVPNDPEDNVEIRLCIKETGKEIGCIELERKLGTNFYMTHSHLDCEFREQGLGALMYARAIQWCMDNNYRARSSGYSSDDAERVWQSKSLKKHYRILTRRPKGSFSRTWFAYEKT